MTKSCCRCLFGGGGSAASESDIDHRKGVEPDRHRRGRGGGPRDLDDESSTSAVDSHRHQNSHRHKNLRSADETGSSCHTTGGDSDFRAVEWLRNRSAESRGSSTGRATELSPAAARAWKDGQQQGQRHRTRIHRTSTAREESIEVDDLTLLGIPRSHHHHYSRTISAPPTDSTSSSSFEYAAPSVQPNTADFSEATTRQSDELDAIVHALTQPASKQFAADQTIDSDARPHYGGTALRGSLPTVRTGATTTALGDDDYERMLLAGPTTQEFLADFDSPVHQTAWSPDARTQPSSLRTAATSPPFQASPAGTSTRYVMQASPRSSPPSSPPRGGGPRRVRTVEQLRSLGPLGTAAPSPLSTGSGVHHHPNTPQDSLSDVPSDVDPQARERYLRACRLLKSALIERDTALLPQERVFLNGLLQHNDDNNIILPTHHANRDRALFDDWEDRTSAIETASLTLMSDPLFQVDSVHSSTFELVEESHRRSFSKGGSGSHLSDEKKDTFSDAGAMGVNNSRSAGEATPPTQATSNAVVGSVARFDGRDVPFYILGISPDFRVGALTPTLMEALRGFFPAALADENLFLKYSLHRDGPSLPALLSKVRTSQHTILAVETSDGHVFGAFCSVPWRVQSTWFGSAETSFLWRLKRPRILPGTTTTTTTGRDFSRDSEMEVYPCTGRNAKIQYCTTQTLAVGGGEWSTTRGEGNNLGDDRCPYPDEPSGIGFMIDGDLMGGETNSCSTFANPRLGQRLSKGNEFDIRCLEVWTVTPAVTIEEAENLEMRRHFVDHRHSMHGLKSLHATAL